jgi:hypothetical protein
VVGPSACQRVGGYGQATQRGEQAPNDSRGIAGRMTEPPQRDGYPDVALLWGLSGRGDPHRTLMKAQDWWWRIGMRDVVCHQDHGDSQEK